MTTFIRLAYLLLLAVLASATFVEWQCGTPFVHRYVYGSWWFAFLIAMVVVPGLILVVRRLRHCRPALLLHFSLAIVALGALLTRLTATDGLLHLRQGQSSTEFLSSGEPHRPVPLPVIVSLDSFQIVCYPHTDAPLDYVSHLRVDGRARRVSMNRVLSVDGYRFYQSSYDPDARGTILTVNHDPWGMTVSYAGYLLTIISFVLIMANPRGRFRRLLRGSAPVVLALLSLTSCSDSTPPHAPIPSPDKVERFSQLDIIYRDRHTPVDTYCFDFLLKVTGSTSFRGLSPQTVVLAWLTSPEEWQNVPMIRVKNESAARSFGLHPVDGYISAKSLFAPDGSYILSPYIRDADKAALDINDRLQAIIALTDGTAFRPAPEPIPSFRRSVEVGYARLRPVALLFKFQLFVGLLLLFLVMRATLRGRPVPSRLFAILSILSAASQAAALAIRGYIARAWPLANGYETMLFLALVIVLVSLVLGRRHALLAAACQLMSGFALLVAHLAISNPHITPLMPVLHSPWLSVHVAAVMIAYALFAIIMLNSLMALFVGRAGSSAALRVSLLLLYVAVAFLTLGIFVGAVWAGESWGRYWGWDSKEVWALITLLVYVLPLHPSIVPPLTRPRASHLYLVLAFLAVLMTYLGVNYLLPGLHSYA